MLAIDWELGGRSGPSYFFSSFYSGRQFQHWPSLLRDSSFYWMCWLWASVVSTSFNSPSRGVLPVLCSAQVWAVSLSCDWLFSFSNIFRAILRYWISSIKLCFSDPSLISTHFHLPLVTESASWIWTNEGMIMIVQNKCLPHDSVLILIFLIYSPWFSLKFSFYTPLFLTFLGFPHYLSLLLFVCHFENCFCYHILYYIGLITCLYHI